MVLRPEKEAEARAVFEKWDLDFAVVGKTIAEDRFVVRRNGEVMAELPLSSLSGTAPEYDRPWEPTPKAERVRDLPDCADPAADLLALIGGPNLCSRAWVWEQYDHTVGADTVVAPGSDAGVVRVHGTAKALAFSSDVTPRYCYADPVEGGRQAVAECFRNLCATGARPLATTDNLNFGNPEKPRIMGQFVGCIQGIGEAVSALDMPIVSGNVSLYNETDGAAILPTPTIVGVGLLESLDELIRMAPRRGDVLVLLGETSGWLDRSIWLQDLHGREEGPPPPVDLGAERRAGELVRALKARGLLRAAHDLSDGGLAVAAAEMALACGCGASVTGAPRGLTAAGWFFGEDQGRYLLACAPKDAMALMDAAAEAGVAARQVGTMEGDALILGGASVPMARLREAHEGGFARMMGEG